MVAITAVTTAFNALSKIKPKIWKGMKDGFNAVGKSAGGMIEFGKALQFMKPLFAPLNTLIDVLGKGILSGLMPAIQMFTDILLDPAVVNALFMIGQGIGMVLGFLLDFGNWFGMFISYASGTLKPVLDGLLIAWQFLADGLKVIWITIFQPVFNFILAGFTILGNGIKLVWDNVLKHIFAVIVWEFQVLGKGFQFVWVFAIQPWLKDIVNGFKLMGEVLLFVWDNILSPWINHIIDGFKLFGQVISWVWNNILNPVFLEIISVFNFLATTIIGMINSLINAINVIIPGTAWDIPTIPAYANGTDFVPNTGIALLHAGEAVLTADENKERNKRKRIPMTSTTINVNVYGNANPQEIINAIERRWG